MAKKYSYIKYPYSENGWFSFTLSVISLVITAAVGAVSIYLKGETGTFIAAVSFTAVVMSFMGLWFTFLSMSEKERNRLFSYIGGSLSLLVCIIWVIVVYKGQK